MQPTGCIHWTGFLDKDGYGIITVDYRSRRVHRVVWELGREPVPPGMMICHHCDNPTCINVDHLYVGTAMQNAADKTARGRTPPRKGEANPGARVNDQLVRQIRAEAQFIPQKDLALAYGLSKVTIHQIVRRKTWTHVED